MLLPQRRMENSEGGTSSEPDSVPTQPTSCPSRASEPVRPPSWASCSSSEHREPKRRREAKQQQQQQQERRRRRRGEGQEQLLRETERRRLPGQREHSEACGSVSDAAESSPKRFARAKCQLVAHATGMGGLTWLLPSPSAGELTSFMDPIQPLTLDPKPAFFLTPLQSCKRPRDYALKDEKGLWMYNTWFESEANDSKCLKLSSFPPSAPHLSHACNTSVKESC